MVHQVAAFAKANASENSTDLSNASPEGQKAATANPKTSSIHTTATANYESIATLACPLHGLSNQFNRTTKENKTIVQVFSCLEVEKLNQIS